MKRIYLIGLTGVGKSTFGQTLANVINFHFVDLDECIINETKCSIPAFFEEKGETMFRQVESNCLLETIQLNKSVIACGGGIVESAANRKWLSENGVVICLSRDLKSILSNIDVSQRPLLKDNPNGLKILYERRKPLYDEIAQLTVDNSTVTDALQEVISFLKEQGGL